MKKKDYTLPLLFVLIIFLTCLNMKNNQVTRLAEAFNQECPFYVGELGKCVGVTCAKDTLVFFVHMLHHSVRPGQEDSTTFQFDSLVSRPEDAKILLGSIFFQPSTEIFEKKKCTDYDGLIDKDCFMRIDVIREDSSTVTSVVFTAKEISRQVTLCLQRENVDSVAYEDILELHKAYSMLSVPQEYDERIIFVSVDYDNKSYNRHLQIVDAPLWFKIDEEMMHDDHVEMITNDVILPPYLKSSADNDLTAFVKACAYTNRDLVYHYFSNEGQERKVVITSDELKQILQRRYVPPTIPDEPEMPVIPELNEIELPDLPNPSDIPD